MKNHFENLRFMFHQPSSSWDWSAITYHAHECGYLGWEYVAENLRLLASLQVNDWSEEARFVRLLVQHRTSSAEISAFLRERFSVPLRRFPERPEEGEVPLRDAAKIVRTLTPHRGKRVRVLDLSDIRLDEDPWARIVDCFDFSHTQSIDVSGCALNADKLEYLLVLCTEFTELTHFNLSMNVLCDESVEHLVTLLNAPKLASLRVMSTMLSHAGRCALLDRFGDAVHSGFLGVTPTREDVFSTRMITASRMDNWYWLSEWETDVIDPYTIYGFVHFDLFEDKEYLWGPVPYFEDTVVRAWGRFSHIVFGTHGMCPYAVFDACGDVVALFDFESEWRTESSKCPHGEFFPWDDRMSYIRLTCRIYFNSIRIMKFAPKHIQNTPWASLVETILADVLRFDLLPSEYRPVDRWSAPCPCRNRG